MRKRRKMRRSLDRNRTPSIPVEDEGTTLKDAARAVAALLKRGSNE